MFRNNLNNGRITADFGADEVQKFVYIKHWMNKWTSGSFEGYEKYTYYWIAFNIYYNLKYLKDNRSRGKTIWNSGEFERVMSPLRTLDIGQKEDIFSRTITASPDFFTLLRRFTLLGKPDRRTQQQEDLIAALDLVISQGNMEKALEKLIECLYVIRCNLFHGEKEPNDERQNRLLEESAKILHKFMSILLEPYFST